MLEPPSPHWSAILLGLAVGIAGRYALALQEGTIFTWRLFARMITIDFLLLGINALIASFAVRQFNLSFESATIMAALIGASSDRIFRLLRAKWEPQFVAALQPPVQLAVDPKGSPVIPEHSNAAVQIVTYEEGDVKERAAGVLQVGKLAAKELPSDPEMYAILDKLKDVPDGGK